MILLLCSDSVLAVYNKELVFLVHHVLCFLVFFGAVYPVPFIQYYATQFLLFELSTPVVHSRWLFRHLHLDKKHPVVYKLLLLAVFGSFTLARIVVGLPLAFCWVRDVFLPITSGDLFLVQGFVPQLVYFYLLALVVLTG